MEKRCTITTIAAKLGVAPSTVSRAFQPESRISDAQRALILKTAKEMNYVPNQAASRLNKREIRIGVLMQNIYPAGQKQLLIGIEEAYQTLSDYKVSYHVVFYDAALDSPEYCAEFFKAFAEDDAIIVAGIGSEYLTAEMEKYIAKGKHIALLQSGPNFPGYLFRSVHNPVAAANLAAEFLSICMARLPRRRVIQFTGSQTLDLHVHAEKAFRSACREFDLELTDVYDMKDSEAALEKLCREVLTPERLRETDGIYITSGLCLPLCRHLESLGMGQDICLVTTDAFEELHPYILRQTVNASIYQNFCQQALTVYEQLVKYLFTQCEIKKTVSPHPELILRSNLRYYMVP